MMEAKLSWWVCQRCHRVAGIHVEGADIPGETRVAFCIYTRGDESGLLHSL